MEVFTYSLISAYAHVYLAACSNMRALLHVYMMGLEALGLLSAEPPSTCTAFLCVQWIRCVCKHRMPW